MPLPRADFYQSAEAITMPANRWFRVLMHNVPALGLPFLAEIFSDEAGYDYGRHRFKF